MPHPPTLANPRGARYKRAMRLRPLVGSLAALALGSGAATAEDVVEPGRRMAVIETPHLRAYVPADQVRALTSEVERAERLYVAMAGQAGYRIRSRLHLLLADDIDSHNGFSTVVPFPLVGVDLAPAPPASGIFAGDGHLRRTLIHEFAHHLSNDRSHGFRRVLERIFGRVLPSDPLSLLTYYLSTPAHSTMPSFWHEGLAQWAETVYAEPGPFAGRGRDPLSHMVWRLDAAGGRIPPVDDWRLSHVRWPFGNMAYLYGLAYTRYLDAAYGDRANIWALIDAQARQKAFAFTDGPLPLLGKDHGELLREARSALLAEQEAQLVRLRAQPVTATTRLTPVDTVVAAPAWTSDGRLFAAINGPYDRPHYARIDADGDSGSAWRSAYAMGGARSLPDGTIIYAETAGGVYAWSRSRVFLLAPDGGAHELAGKRLIQPDVRRRDGRYAVAAVRLLDAGRQELVLAPDALGPAAWMPVPAQGRPWSPAFRPAHDELAWVETDAGGSRLVLAPLADPARRTILAEVKGRLLHPAWSPDGRELFVCADHSGVANAYVVDPARPGALTAITNTIGGILACVPSPDGRELALVEHDRRGPYLARIPNDPAARPGDIPIIAITWPAPVARQPATRQPEAEEEGLLPSGSHPLAPLPEEGGSPTRVGAYHGLPAMRPRYWTPTTLPVPDGGFGVVGVATDPLLQHVAVASVGVGPSEGEPVGLLAYAYTGWPVELGVLGWQSERTYADLLVDTAGVLHDYTERIASAEVRVGRGLAGFRTRLLAYLSAGLSDARTVDDGAERYADRTIVTPEPFRGGERYVEATFGYDDALLFPTSYAPENGLTGTLSFRRSGFGGDLERDRVLARGGAALSVWPTQGHQLRLSGAAGASAGDQPTQRAFGIGGALGQGLPRGYPEIEAVGQYLAAGSVAYRFPVWRHFKGFGSSPWVHRQVVLEAFYDAGIATDDRSLRSGGLYESVGGEIHDCWEFHGILLQPGIGVARQLDGDEDTVVYLALGFGL